jgi:hypothetical protein
MHPDWMKWLKQESLFDVAVFELIRFHDMPRSRRIRTRNFWNEYDEALANAAWADSSPVLGCTIRSIGCPECLSHRQAIQLTGEDMWCPWKTNANSEEKCFWGEDGIDGGLCEGCVRQVQHGCGFGFHHCTACIVDNHSAEEIVQHCSECGPCPGRHENEEEGGQHCRKVCPYNSVVCG